MQNTIDGIIHKRSNPYHLGIHQLSFNTPTLPYFQDEQEISLYQDEKLNLVSMVRLWTLSMKNMLEELKSGSPLVAADT